MDAFVNLLQGTPLPTIFVVAGIGFVLLGIAGQVAGKVEVAPHQRRLAAGIGAAFIVFGVALYAFPADGDGDLVEGRTRSSSASVTPAEPTATPTLPPTPSAPATATPTDGAPSAALVELLPWVDVCTQPLVLPEVLDPAADREAALAEYRRQRDGGGDLSAWRRAPAAGVVEVGVMVQSLQAGGAWLRIEPAVEARVHVRAAPEHVNVIQECAGADEYRRFSEVPLATDFPEYALDATYNDADFFSLAPGEFEAFVFPFRCAAPGVYDVELTLRVSQENETSTVVFEPSALVCPMSFTTWVSLADFSPDEAVTWRWDGAEYVRE